VLLIFVLSLIVDQSLNLSTSIVEVKLDIIGYIEKLERRVLATLITHFDERVMLITEVCHLNIL
jgi:hypothetical protein